jgi:hypothetical protein
MIVAMRTTSQSSRKSSSSSSTTGGGPPPVASEAVSGPPAAGGRAHGSWVVVTCAVTLGVAGAAASAEVDVDRVGPWPPAIIAARRCSSSATMAFVRASRLTQCTGTSVTPRAARNCGSETATYRVAVGVKIATIRW